MNPGTAPNWIATGQSRQDITTNQIGQTSPGGSRMTPALLSDVRELSASFETLRQDRANDSAAVILLTFWRTSDSIAASSADVLPYLVRGHPLLRLE